MDQVWIPRFGPADVLEVRSAPEPHAGSGEVRIAVEAAGVNFADVSARAGLYPDAPKPPMVVGYEVSGIVDEVGAGVDGVAAGDPVLALTRFGGYSSSVVVPVVQTCAAPAAKDLRTAAALPVNFLTASLTLHRLAGLRRGESVLVHGAAGGVGLAAVQLAKQAGAVTIGTASAAKHERLKEFGLGYAIDYRNQDFAEETMRITGGRGADVILDPIGGSTTRKNYRCLAPLGRLVCFGLSSASAPSRRQAWRTFPRALASTPIFHPVQLINANKGVWGFNLGRLWDHAELLRDTLRELTDMWSSGLIEPVIDSTYPFTAAAEAHTQLETGRNFGKVLLIPS
jgi:NADPH:quinone reductase-like Zn-dependent oxidoreductase